MASSTTARLLCVVSVAAWSGWLTGCSDSATNGTTDGPLSTDARPGDAPRAFDAPRTPDGRVIDGGAVTTVDARTADGGTAPIDAPAHAVDAAAHAVDAPISFDAHPGTPDAHAGSIDAPPNAIDAPPVGAIDAGVSAPDARPFPTVTLGLTQIATGLDRPVAIAVPPGETRSFVVEQHLGHVSIIENGTPRATPFIDMANVATISTDNEEGLLGLAFHPDYATNGRVFVYWTGTATGSGEAPTTCHVWEFHRGDDANVTDGTHKEVLNVLHPSDTNHNGGNIQFGADGMLYIGLGDGGGSFDSHTNSRKLSERLSKILRIDVDHGDPYMAPTDNPFFGTSVEGDTTHAADDIWMWGLRNPWRWSFDRQTHDLWIGDVGQNCWEEIDVARDGQKGLDFGWETVEGLGHCPTGNCDSTKCTQPGATLPVLEYDHSQGSDVIGGYVYRGTKIPEIQGLYFFSDDATSFVRTFWADSPVPYAQTKNWTALHKSAISTFGEDPDGELRFCQVLDAPNGACWEIMKPASVSKLSR